MPGIINNAILGQISNPQRTPGQGQGLQSQFPQGVAQPVVQPKVAINPGMTDAALQQQAGVVQTPGMAPGWQQPVPLQATGVPVTQNKVATLPTLQPVINRAMKPIQTPAAQLRALPMPTQTPGMQQAGVRPRPGGGFGVAKPFKLTPAGGIL